MALMITCYIHCSAVPIKGRVLQVGPFVMALTFTDTAVSASGSAPGNPALGSIAVNGVRSLNGAFNNYAGIYVSQGDYTVSNATNDYHIVMTVSCEGAIWLMGYTSEIANTNIIAYGMLNADGTFALTSVSLPGFVQTGRFLQVDGEYQVTIDAWEGQPHGVPLLKDAVF